MGCKIGKGFSIQRYLQEKVFELVESQEHSLRINCIHFHISFCLSHLSRDCTLPLSKNHADHVCWFIFLKILWGFL